MSVSHLVTIFLIRMVFNMINKLRDAKWVSEFLDVKLARVYELARAKRLPVILVGERQYRFSEQALMKWVENGGNLEQESTEEATIWDR